MKVRIVKKGLPKAQYQNSQITGALAPISMGSATTLIPNALNTPNFAWMNLNPQAPAAFPNQPLMYNVNNQGTPVSGSPDIVPLMKFNKRYVSQPALMADGLKGFIYKD